MQSEGKREEEEERPLKLFALVVLILVTGSAEGIWLPKKFDVVVSQRWRTRNGKIETSRTKRREDARRLVLHFRGDHFEFQDPQHLYLSSNHGFKAYIELLGSGTLDRRSGQAEGMVSMRNIMTRKNRPYSVTRDIYRLQGEIDPQGRLRLRYVYAYTKSCRAKVSRDASGRVHPDIFGKWEICPRSLSVSRDKDTYHMVGRLPVLPPKAGSRDLSQAAPPGRRNVPRREVAMKGYSKSRVPGLHHERRNRGGSDPGNANRDEQWWDRLERSLKKRWGRPRVRTVVLRWEALHTYRYAPASFKAWRGSGHSPIPIRDVQVTIEKWSPREKKIGLTVETPVGTYREKGIYCFRERRHYRCAIEDDAGYVNLRDDLSIQADVDFSRYGRTAPVITLHLSQRRPGSWIPPGS